MDLCGEIITLDEKTPSRTFDSPDKAGTTAIGCEFRVKSETATRIDITIVEYNTNRWNNTRFTCEYGRLYLHDGKKNVHVLKILKENPFILHS